MRVGIFVSETWDDASSVDEVRARASAADELGLAEPQTWDTTSRSGGTR